MNLYRHDIDFGESVRWTPPAGASTFYVWAKRSADGAAMRWKRVAGWDIDRATTLPVSEATGNINLSGPEFTMDWAGVLIAFDGFDTEILQVTAHDADTKVIRRDVYTIPAPTSTDAAVIVAQERRLLKDLIELRGKVGEGGNPFLKVKDPSGTEYELQSLAALDRRVSEVRARIAWFEAAADGNVLPRAEFW